MEKFDNVKDYYAAVSPKLKPALNAVRKQVKALLPECEEAISYGIPTFKVGGRSVVHIAAFKNHCSFFPGSAIVERYADELKGFKASKGTIQFTPEHPLPDSLIERIVRDRLEAENPRMRPK